ncbi:flagellar export protein FliJ [Bosea sp. 117]|uniref:flagellar export protein FliJ n=1 Tax=Bosea sp. 117 TaxID=1125973 RepID=UPI000494704D|nr:flagellar export protein FliJ [Bosea sp. 117]
MSSRDTLIRLKRFQAEEKRRHFVQIETMIAEFERMAHELDREIAVEQQRAGITDPNHFAYPTYARAAAGRRDNLKASADELKQQLDDARAALDAALEELGKVEALGERERGIEAPVETARATGRPRASLSL